MAASGVTCGNCSKEVNESDITCPHCGALLAAYASPDGSVVTTPEYSTPSYAAPPPLTEIVQDRTAPEPLFDTNITVADIAVAAELDTPVELLLAGEELPQEPDDDAPEPDVVHAPEPVDTDYPWPAAELETRTPGREVAMPEPPPSAPISTSVSVGETEDYLRKLHRRSGYKSDTGNLSTPVTNRRPTPADRAANRAARESARNRNQPVTPLQAPGLNTILKIAAGLLWLILLGTAMAGNANLPILVFTVVLTMWLKMQGGRGGR